MFISSKKSKYEADDADSVVSFLLISSGIYQVDKERKTEKINVVSIIYLGNRNIFCGFIKCS